MDGFKNDIRDDKPHHPPAKIGYILLYVGEIARDDKKCSHMECIYCRKQYRIVLINRCQMECDHQQN